LMLLLSAGESEEGPKVVGFDDELGEDILWWFGSRV
jgi:hypothetical protein